MQLLPNAFQHIFSWIQYKDKICNVQTMKNVIVFMNVIPATCSSNAGTVACLPLWCITFILLKPHYKHLENFWNWKSAACSQTHVVISLIQSYLFLIECCLESFIFPIPTCLNMVKASNSEWLCTLIEHEYYIVVLFLYTVECKLRRICRSLHCVVSYVLNSIPTF